MSDKLRDIKFKVVGVTFRNDDGSSRQDIIANITQDAPISIMREPTNRFDKNAIKVLYVDQQIGYIPREFAQILAPMMDSGRQFTAKVNVADRYEGTYYCHIIVDEV